MPDPQERCHSTYYFWQMLAINPSISEALAQNQPVVALESTLIAHGMPWPTNLETALAVEKKIRELGAVPATIGILNGKLCVGLDSDALEQLAKAGKDVIKCSPRDMASVIARKQLGATTVAGTLFGARAAGIAVMATGGIGGVHRGAGVSFDVSSDLLELSRSPIVLVSAGAKSILDLSATLEYMETLAIPVVGYGTDEFPAFYRRKSGLAISCTMNTPQEIAELLRIRKSLNMAQGILIANPIPIEHEAELGSINAAIDQALLESDERKLIGQAITPFLLARIAELTQGESLAANIRLVMNNAILAANLSIEIALGYE